MTGTTKPSTMTSNWLSW